MKRIDLKAGLSCNNHCRFYVQKDKRRKYPDKSIDKIKSSLRKKGGRA